MERPSYDVFPIVSMRTPCEHSLIVESTLASRSNSPRRIPANISIRSASLVTSGFPLTSISKPLRDWWTSVSPNRSWNRSPRTSKITLSNMRTHRFSPVFNFDFLCLYEQPNTDTDRVAMDTSKIFWKVFLLGTHIESWLKRCIVTHTMTPKYSGSTSLNLSN